MNAFHESDFECNWTFIPMTIKDLCVGACGKVKRLIAKITSQMLIHLDI